MREGDDGLKQLHTDDLSMNSGKLLREQLTENFKAIEYAINDLYGQIDKLKQKDQEDQNFLKNLYK